MTKASAGLPTKDEFCARARTEFSYLRDFGFREEPIPFSENPHLNEFAVWFVSPTTRVVVEGMSWGLDARVAFGRYGPLATFENLDLGDLITIRQPSRPGKFRKGQLDQLTDFAVALRELGNDVLWGDRSVFPEIQAIVERRRAEFAKGQRPST